MGKYEFDYRSRIVDLNSWNKDAFTYVVKYSQMQYLKIRNKSKSSGIWYHYMTLCRCV